MNLSIHIYLFMIVCLYILHHRQLSAKVTGRCDNCHTMHNSQDGIMVDPNGTHNNLLINNCVGCHSSETSSTYYNLGGCDVPVVFYTGGTAPTEYLAGGNFYWEKESDSKVHNIRELDNGDDILGTNPPSGSFPHPVTLGSFTCAGTGGCHGNRFRGEGSMLGLKGAHHQNIDGQCTSADEVYNSYRFLKGVKGFENTSDRWQNVDESSHNEYYGLTSPPADYEFSCELCHQQITVTDSLVVAPNNTISGFCATCHGNFHSLDGRGGDTGIGGDIYSPFSRHPTDIVLPSDGEYGDYTLYSVEAPVARQNVPSSSNTTVTPGDDVVMCLSCHMAHGSPYPDILRWNYDSMLAGGGGGSGGCFTCHTQKDN